MAQKSVQLNAGINSQASANVKIANHGKGILNGMVSGPAGEPFSVLGIGPFTFSPHNSKRVKVMFSPTSKGTFSAQLTITSDDPDRPSISVPITGTAN